MQKANVPRGRALWERFSFASGTCPLDPQLDGELKEIAAARDVSADLHATYGGEGPMTPEP